MSESQLNQYFALLAVMALWELIWKGLALWRAAQREEKGWYVAILLLNTVGILPILYLYVFSQKEKTIKKGSET